MEQIRITDLVYWAFTVLGWAVAALVWYLGRMSARSGDNHQKIYSIVEGTKELISDVELTARKYWTVHLDKESMMAERQYLIVKSSDILRNISSLSDRSSCFVGFYPHVKEFHEAILGQDGESLNRDRLSEDDPRITRIRVAAECLHSCLRKAYNEESARGWFKLKRK